MVGNVLLRPGLRRGFLRQQRRVSWPNETSGAKPCCCWTLRPNRSSDCRA